jgi:proline dehydrogenase
MLRAALISASESATARRIVTGWSLPRRIAHRFVAGTTLDEGIEAARALKGSGRTATLDYLGESVTSEHEARAACATYVEALARIGAAGLDCGVSVKPTQMGLKLDRGLAAELIGTIVVEAERAGVHVTLDMEGRDVTEATVSLVEELRAAGHREVGCAVQAYLRRTRADIGRLNRVKASVRLCKGAYAEPPSVAFAEKEEVDVNYAACADLLLREGTFPRIATHDHVLIDNVRQLADHLGLGRDAFEFQMLYGVRTALQEQLVRDGYAVRVYVPFGEQWYPYFMRRLAERPANVAFFLRALRGG